MQQEESRCTAAKREQPPLPELLSPAGTPQALDAAIAAGADAVYFGAGQFNARMFAGNFEGELLHEAIAKCRAFGVKSNLTLNTLAPQQTLSEQLALAEQLLFWGADALIVADVGVAAAIHRAFPQAVLHASTQCGGHSTLCAEELRRFGFSRMVAAREVPMQALQTLCRESPLETEVFVHGALCVCRSGSCLFSAMVGGRSGNRGACAQPCRLPCRVDGGRDEYALSLKDLCLAGQMETLCSMGIASLKIEGRMKSAEYVYGVTKLYRTLLDERRNATAQELLALEALFSRSGFTDAYFTGKSLCSMGGVRTEENKESTRRAESELAKELQAPHLAVQCKAKLAAGEAAQMILQCGTETVAAAGQAPSAARSAALTEAAVREKLTAFGGTWFFPQKAEIALQNDIFLPAGALGALRRAAQQALQERLTQYTPCEKEAPLVPFSVQSGDASQKEEVPGTARAVYAGGLPEKKRAGARVFAAFQNAAQVPQEHGAIDVLFLPLAAYADGSAERVGARGVILPPVSYDTELAGVRAQIRIAVRAGAREALVTSLCALALCREAALVPHGSLLLDIENSGALAAYGMAGLCTAALSPELTEREFAAVKHEIPKGVLLYGAVPLMLLERCLMRKAENCSRCEKTQKTLYLTDRRGVRFPIVRLLPHRNLLYNSVPTYLIDRKEALLQAGAEVFWLNFTTESRARCARILQAFKAAEPPQLLFPDGAYRRAGLRRTEKTEAPQKKQAPKTRGHAAADSRKGAAQQEKSRGKRR